MPVTVDLKNILNNSKSIVSSIVKGDKGLTEQLMQKVSSQNLRKSSYGDIIVQSIKDFGSRFKTFNMQDSQISHIWTGSVKLPDLNGKDTSDFNPHTINATQQISSGPKNRFSTTDTSGKGVIVPRGKSEVVPPDNGVIVPRGKSEVVPPGNGKYVSPGNGKDISPGNGEIVQSRIVTPLNSDNSDNSSKSSQSELDSGESDSETDEDNSSDDSGRKFTVPVTVTTNGQPVTVPGANPCFNVVVNVYANGSNASDSTSNMGNSSGLGESDGSRRRKKHRHGHRDRESDNGNQINSESEDERLNRLAEGKRTDGLNPGSSTENRRQGEENRRQGEENRLDPNQSNGTNGNKQKDNGQAVVSSDEEEEDDRLSIYDIIFNQSLGSDGIITDNDTEVQMIEKNNFSQSWLLKITYKKIIEDFDSTTHGTAKNMSKFYRDMIKNKNDILTNVTKILTTKNSAINQICSIINQVWGITIEIQEENDKLADFIQLIQSTYIVFNDEYEHNNDVHDGQNDANVSQQDDKHNNDVYEDKTNANADY